MKPPDFRIKKSRAKVDPAQTASDLELLREPPPQKKLRGKLEHFRQFKEFQQQTQLKPGDLCGFETTILYAFFLWWIAETEPDAVPLTPRMFSHHLRRNHYRRTHRIKTDGRERRCYGMQAKSVKTVAEWLKTHPISQADYDRQHRPRKSKILIS